jgi:hypothetical protein
MGGGLLVMIIMQFGGLADWLILWLNINGLTIEDRQEQSMTIYAVYAMASEIEDNQNATMMTA